MLRTPRASPTSLLCTRPPLLQAGAEPSSGTFSSSRALSPDSSSVSAAVSNYLLFCTACTHAIDLGHDHATPLNGTLQPCKCNVTHHWDYGVFVLPLVMCFSMMYALASLYIRSCLLLQRWCRHGQHMWVTTQCWRMMWSSCISKRNWRLTED